MPGFIVTAKQTYYPIELSNSELLSHFNTIKEYNEDITFDCISHFKKFRPDVKLIDQQPEMIPQLTRQSMITFLYKISILSKVTNGIFYHATRLYDRYCSKRIVLRDQAKLVLASCLWLAAKTYGGCNHVINNYVIPTGGRFYGPNPRARIPRLSELVHYCNNEKNTNDTNSNNLGNNNNLFDESMFCQMELHILDTLNWNVYEPMINDLILNVDENCLIQYELYKSQLENRSRCTNNSTINITASAAGAATTSQKNYENKRHSHDSTDTDATVDDIDDLINEDKELVLKIELINLKRFLIDLSCWQYDLLKYDIEDIVSVIFKLINMFGGHDVSPLLSLTTTTTDMTLSPCMAMSSPSNFKSTINDNIQTIFINSLINVPQALLLVYKDKSGIIPFIFKVKEYYTNLQRMNIMDVARNRFPSTQYFDSYNNNNSNNNNNNFTDTSSIESSPSLSVTTPSKQQLNISNSSSNSITVSSSNKYINNSTITNTVSSINSNIHSSGDKTEGSIFSNHHYPYVNGSTSFSASTVSPITPQLFTFPISKNDTNDKENDSIIPLPHVISSNPKSHSNSQDVFKKESSMLRFTTESQQNSLNNHIR